MRDSNRNRGNHRLLVGRLNGVFTRDSVWDEDRPAIRPLQIVWLFFKGGGGSGGGGLAFQPSKESLSVGGYTNPYVP